MSGGKFKFPAATYYNESQSMYEKISSFTDDMDLNFFDVVNSNLSSISPKDVASVQIPTDQGKRKQRTFTNTFAKKWNSMKSEQASNPMYGVVEADKKYSEIFSELASGEQQKKIQSKQGVFEVTVMANIVGEEASEFIEMMQEGSNHDWYSRIMQGSSAGTFFDDFERKFAKYAKKHPKQAEKLLQKLDKDKTFRNLLNKKGKNDAFTKLRNSPAGKTTKMTSRAMKNIKNVFNGKIVRRVAGAGKKYLKGPWGTVVAAGFHGYDNFTSEEVQKDFEEGKNARGTAKGVAGTAIDTLKHVGPIDGLITGAIAGGPYGAVAGLGLGAINQGLQFINPNIYEDSKELVNQGIDWTADTAVATWDSAKKLGSNISKGVKDLGNTLNSVADTAKKAVDIAQKGKDLLSGFKPSFLG